MAYSFPELLSSREPSLRIVLTSKLAREKAPATGSVEKAGELSSDEEGAVMEGSQIPTACEIWERAEAAA